MIARSGLLIGEMVCLGQIKKNNTCTLYIVQYIVQVHSYVPKNLYGMSETLNMFKRLCGIKTVIEVKRSATPNPNCVSDKTAARHTSFQS